MSTQLLIVVLYTIMSGISHYNALIIEIVLGLLKHPVLPRPPMSYSREERMISLFVLPNVAAVVASLYISA